MRYFTSVAHIGMLLDLVRDKRVLDVGDADSPFLAKRFALRAQSWIVVGRPPPPMQAALLPKNVAVVIEQFSPETPPVQPSEVDVILFPFPSPTLAHDAACLKWATPDHLIVFLGAPGNEASHGSPAFWEIARTLETKNDLVDEQGRFLIMQKKGASLSRTSVKIPAPGPVPLTVEKKAEKGVQEEVVQEEKEGEEEEKEEEEKGPGLPKKGDRYRLVPSCLWPDKERGDRPPVVQIVDNFTQTSGPCKVVPDGQTFDVHVADLGTQL